MKVIIHLLSFNSLNSCAFVEFLTFGSAACIDQEFSCQKAKVRLKSRVIGFKVKVESWYFNCQVFSHQIDA